jgi:hypothetical protein
MVERHVSDAELVSPNWGLPVRAAPQQKLKSKAKRRAANEQARR